MKKVFDAYADYYDLLYSGKDYKSEAEYIEKMFRSFVKKGEKILNLGCGTGRHDLEFAIKGYNVTGVEISDKMLRIAKKNSDALQSKSGVKFKKGDLKKIKLKEKFDIVLALFHVMSYQTSADDIKNSLRNVRRHLKKNGIFIFDFWYGPAVLSERPERRTIKLSDSEITLERKALPKIKINENAVDVNYKVKVKHKKSGNEKNFTELHKMRYFFLPEIIYFLNDSGLKLTSCREWLTGKELTDKSWSAVASAVIK